MKTHYFQRYHQKENVATANTMLLLSRLYQSSSDRFFQFLKSEVFYDSFEPEIVFKLQDKHADSVPDATITQESFKIVVETKIENSFDSEQLKRHLNCFRDEKNKVLITLAPEPMAEDEKNDFEKHLKEYNAELKHHIIHINTTFKDIVHAIQEFIDDRDYEMQYILEDYLDYCNKSKLIPEPDSWKYMRMQLAGKTFDFNVRENVYYDIELE